MKLNLYFDNMLGDRASIVRRDDNLHMEGEFQTRQKETWHQGEIILLEEIFVFILYRVS